MVGFTKLHGLILDSSIWQEPDHVRLVWITMLAMADRDGVVQASVGGLASRARVSRDLCEQALEVLLGPDPDSRDGTTGERLERVPGGWLLLNYAQYRDKQTRQQRQTAARVRRHRANHAEGEIGTPHRGDAEGRGYVYYAADGTGLIKIGFSVNPWARLKEHQVSNPRMELLATEQGTIWLEQERHKEFADLLREGREWFEHTGPLATFVAQLRSARSTTSQLRSSYSPPEAEAEAEAEVQNKAASPPRARAVARPDDVPVEVWEDFRALRKAKRAPLTPTAWSRLVAQVEKAPGWTLAEALAECVTRGWSGFKAEWVKDRSAKKSGPVNMNPNAVSSGALEAARRKEAMLEQERSHDPRVSGLCDRVAERGRVDDV